MSGIRGSDRIRIAGNPRYENPKQTHFWISKYWRRLPYLKSLWLWENRSSCPNLSLLFLQRRHELVFVHRHLDDEKSAHIFHHNIKKCQYPQPVLPHPGARLLQELCFRIEHNKLYSQVFIVTHRVTHRNLDKISLYRIPAK